jgi:hypothetical protein
MAARIPIPPDLDSRPFHVRAGRAAGLSSGRMRGLDLASPFWGVRILHHAPELHLRCAAYLQRAHCSAFFSHVTAARLLGIRLPLRFEVQQILDVAVPYPKRAPSANGIRAHKLHIQPSDVGEVAGLPCTGAIRTLLDIAHLLTAEELLAAADSVVWWRQPLATLEDLVDAGSEFRGRGSKTVVKIVPHVSDRSDSSPESVIRWRMLVAGLPAFEANIEIHDAQGRFVAMPDLASREYRMALDYEGDHHRTDAKQWQKDISRVPRLQDADWHHTRISAQDLRSSVELLARLTRLLLERGWRP